MLNAYEQHLLASYLVNAASGLHHRDPEASELADWVTSKESRIAVAGNRRRCRGRWADEDRDEGMSANKLRSLHKALRTDLASTRKPRGDRTTRRLRHLARTLHLTRTDLDILELLLRYQTQPVIESMVDDVFACGVRGPNPLNLRGPAVPVLLGVTATTVHRRLRDDAPLVRSGLVSIDDDGDLNAVSRLNRLVTAPGGQSLDVHRLLLDATPPSELEWSDFDHVAQGRDYILNLLEGALRTGDPGVNVILYGPPGTGKTALCRALAERLGVTLYSVGESDESGNEPTRGERLQELRLSQRLVAGSRRSLLLFDEMEDLLADSHADWGFVRRSRALRLRHGGSKVYLHRLLEQAPAPTLWTMNAARAGPFFSPGRGGEMSETTDAGVDSGRAPNSPRRPHGGGSDPANGVFGLSGQSCPTPPGGAPGRA